MDYKDLNMCVCVCPTAIITCSLVEVVLQTIDVQIQIKAKYLKRKLTLISVERRPTLLAQFLHGLQVQLTI